MLKDKEIRTALKQHLLRRVPAPVKLVEELGIHNGNAIADLVAFYGEMHCFEIKGQTDNVKRVLRQSEFYDESFPKLTLVTTSNHLRWAEENLPRCWGIMLAEQRNDEVMLSYKRKAKNNPGFVKRKAFMMLWKDELTRIAVKSVNVKVKSSYSREDIAIKVSELLGKNDALASIQGAILARD